MAVESGIITSGRQSFNLLNFGTCFLLSLGSFVYGYFAGIIGTTLTKASFLSYMHLIDAQGRPTPNAPGLIGATTGVFQVRLFVLKKLLAHVERYQAGGVFGIILSGYLADKIGRKPTAIYNGILGIIASALITASQNVGMFIVLRFFTGASGFGFLTVMTVYCAELAPAALRGLYVGLNGAVCAFGFAVSSYFGVAFFNVSDTVQWRVPLALGTVFPLVVTIAYIFVPESPRHLLMQGRKEASLKVILSQHGRNGHEDFARAEFFQMEKQAELDLNNDASWKQFYSKPSVRRRVMIAAALAFLSQSTGNLVINNYVRSTICAQPLSTVLTDVPRVLHCGAISDTMLTLNYASKLDTLQCLLFSM
jgi:MFS family permease